jgi:AcrR family transcriptional regulator
VETRNRILAASRQVIIERGYQAATFQAIALAAGLSRPTLHYYFTSREEIYQALVAESGAALADCIAVARQRDTLIEQFSALFAAMHEADLVDRSQVAFLVSSRLESTRNAELRGYAGLELSDFLKDLVGEAKERGELPEHVAVEPVVELLRAMLWGVGFYAGFVDDAVDVRLITQQLGRLFSHGLLGCAECSSAPRDT